MIQTPRIDANPMSLRHLCAAAEPGRDTVGSDIPIGCRGDPQTMFDPDYAAFRGAILSLARDGHDLLRRIAEGGTEADPRDVRDFLRRIDRLKEEASRHRAEPVRRWLRQVRCLILDQAAPSRCEREEAFPPDMT